MPQHPTKASGRENILIALGGNATSQHGEAAETVRSAIFALPDAGLRVVRVSRLFRSPAFPPGSGPDFVNAAAVLAADMAPADILNALHSVEAAHGRVRGRRWGPRTLDLDLLAVGGQILPDIATLRHWMDLPGDRQRVETPDRLILPHPRLQDRAFVLIPLAEVAPDWVHPLTGLGVAEMAAGLPDSDRMAIKPL